MLILVPDFDFKINSLKNIAVKGLKGFLIQVMLCQSDLIYMGLCYRRVYLFWLVVICLRHSDVLINHTIPINRKKIYVERKLHNCSYKNAISINDMQCNQKK